MGYGYRSTAVQPMYAQPPIEIGVCYYSKPAKARFQHRLPNLLRGPTGRGFLYQAAVLTDAV